MSQGYFNKGHPEACGYQANCVAIHPQNSESGSTLLDVAKHRLDWDPAYVWLTRLIPEDLIGLQISSSHVDTCAGPVLATVLRVVRAQSTHFST